MDRRLLYAGVFLVAIGGVLLAAEVAAVDAATLADTLRLWPIAFIAVGAGLLLRRTSVGLPVGMLAAAVPGLVLGGAFAFGPRYAGDCGARGEPSATAVEQGSFAGPANVSIRSGCGALTVGTAGGNAWRFTGGNTAGRVPSVVSSPSSLAIDRTGHERWQFLDAGRDSWDVTLPTTDIESLSLTTFASHGQVALPGARIARLAVTANASHLVVDATGAAVAELSAVVNVGSLSIHLPADGDVSGSLRIGGSDLRVCAPPGTGLRVATRGFASRVTVAGLQQNGPEWLSPKYASAAHRADLSVRVNFGTVQIDPIGGCR